MSTGDDGGDRDDLIHRRLFVRLGAVAFAAFASGSMAARGAEQAGLIEDVKGEGFVEAGPTRRALAPAAPVFIADRVGTGPASRLALQLGQRTKVRLGAETRLTIDRYLVDAGGVLTLDSGAML